MGFNCQLLLLEIGLTMDSSHNTWFHKIRRFFRSKSSRFYMKKRFFSAYFDTGRRRNRLGIVKKKQRKQNQVKMIRINPFLLRCAKDLTISEGTVATSLFNFHSRVLCISTPFFFETSNKNEMD